MNLPVANLPLFLGGSVLLLWWSRHPLRRPGSHGFYRFFAWECILVLILLHREAAGGQVLAQTLLILSLVLLGSGFGTLWRHGRHQAARPEASMYVWERSTALVSSGIFALIRHPMYASLLALNWGMYFRACTLAGLPLALIATLFLWLTALADERECLAFFGPSYLDYMGRTKRFIPYLF